MKYRNLFHSVMLCAAVALAGCSNDETPRKLENCRTK